MNLIELPDLVLLQIASNFSIQDKAALRQVSKRLKWLVDHLFVQEKLFLFQHPLYSFIDPRQQQWPCGASVKREHSICLKNRRKEATTNYLGSSRCNATHFNSKSEFLSSLKCLYLMNIHLYENKARKRFLKGLNCLRELQVLVIENCGHEGHLDSLKLDLPLLKVLHLEEQSYQAIELNTPSLQEFRSVKSLINDPNNRKRSVSSIDFKHPESLRTFVCGHFNYELELANLEVLICQKIPRRFDLCKLPKLRRLEVYPTFQSEIHSSSQESARRGVHLQSYYRMLSEKRSLASRRNLEIRLLGFSEKLFQNSGVDLEIPREYPHFSIHDRYAQLLAQNYGHLLSSMPYSVKVNFSSLTNCFPEQIPDCFFVKFPFIRVVHVDRLADTSLLIPFLRGVKHVASLTLQESFKQEVVDQLPTIESIEHLALHHIPKNLNLNFLTQIKELQKFELFRVCKCSIGSIPEFTETIWKSLKNLLRMVTRRGHLVNPLYDFQDSIVIVKEPTCFWITAGTICNYPMNLYELLQIVRFKEYYLNDFLIPCDPLHVLYDAKFAF